VAVVLGGAWVLRGGDDGPPGGPATPIAEHTTTTTPATTSSVVAPTTTAAPPPPPIPGIRAETVHAELGRNNFECTPSTDLLAEGYEVVDCLIVATTASVRTYATAAGELVAVEGFAYTEVEQRWLLYVAGLPWAGADPVGAQSWVADTIASGAVPVAGRETTTIGGQPLALSFTGGEIWSIVVGQPPPTI
jgi:hypothetical protein